MLHIDVRNERHNQDIVVEVSNDGAPWHRLATFPYTVGDPEQGWDVEKRQGAACDYARAWRDGARYAGAEVKGTAFGYAL